MIWTVESEIPICILANLSPTIRCPGARTATKTLFYNVVIFQLSMSLVRSPVSGSSLSLRIDFFVLSIER